MTVKSINKTGLLKILLIIISFLIAGNIIDTTFRIELGYRGLVPAISQYFNLDGESNIPTLFSSIILLFSSYLLFLISITYKVNNTKFYSWFFLSLIFLILSIDETASLHEGTGQLFQKYFNVGNTLKSNLSDNVSWVIPIGIALIILSIIYSKFIISLPRKTRNLFIISAITFVIGAIGFEVLGMKNDQGESRNFGLFMFILVEIINIEELLEMLGVSIFIYSLIGYIEFQYKVFNIEIKQCKPYFFLNFKVN